MPTATAGPTANTKVVIRNLPPNMQEADLRAAIDETSVGDYNWFHFVQGKNSLKTLRHSRAYLNFNCSDSVYAFKTEFERHVFVSDRGAQYRSTVEYAPCQTVPKLQSKRDPREGTLETDADYLAFKEVLELPTKPLPSAEAILQQKEASEAPAQEQQPVRITPLMQFLNEKHTRKLPSKKVLQRNQSTEPTAAAQKTIPIKQKERNTDKPSAAQTVATKPTRRQLATQPATASVSKPALGVQGTIPLDGRVAGQSQAHTSQRLAREASKRATEETSAVLAAASNSTAAGGGEMATDNSASSKPEKPVRVRAGFQVYTPKHLGRLVTAASSSAAEALTTAGFSSGATPVEQHSIAKQPARCTPVPSIEVQEATDTVSEKARSTSNSGRGPQSDPKSTRVRRHKPAVT